MATAVDSAASRQTALTTNPSGYWLLERWHLLSLDAPTVAGLWSIFFARVMRIDLPWHSPVILAIGTWLIYVADRLLDGRRRSSSSNLQRRHWFHARHSAAFLAGALCASSALLWLIASRMAPPARREDAILFAAAMLYFLLVHKVKATKNPWLPKELAVGIVFAAATAVPAWSRLPPAARVAIFPSVALFAALCWLNCVAIERWESQPGTPAAHDLERSHVTTRWTASHLRLVALLLASISVALAAAEIFPLSAREMPGIAPFYLAALAAALCFEWLDRNRDKFSSFGLRIAADLALLTPLLFLPFLR